MVTSRLTSVLILRLDCRRKKIRMALALSYEFVKGIQVPSRCDPCCSHITVLYTQCIHAKCMYVCTPQGERTRHRDRDRCQETGTPQTQTLSTAHCGKQTTADSYRHLQKVMSTGGGMLFETRFPSNDILLSLSLSSTVTWNVVVNGREKRHNSESNHCPRDVPLTNHCPRDVPLTNHCPRDVPLTNHCPRDVPLTMYQSLSP